MGIIATHAGTYTYVGFDNGNYHPGTLIILRFFVIWVVIELRTKSLNFKCNDAI